MNAQSVELVCTTCGLVEDVPLSPAEMRAMVCEGCGGQMVLAMEEADEADRAFAEGRRLVTA